MIFSSYFSFFCQPIEHRLTEQEANEEIRIAMQNFMIQLQSVRDRVPSRGSAMATIGVLLENCKPLTNTPATLMPPTTAALQATAHNATTIKKTGNNMNGLAASSIDVSKQCADKSTNTNTDESIHCQHEPQKQSLNQLCGTAGTPTCCTTKISITDASSSCDNNNKHCSDLGAELCQNQQKQQIDKVDNLGCEPHNQNKKNMPSGNGMILCTDKTDVSEVSVQSTNDDSGSGEDGDGNIVDVVDSAGVGDQKTELNFSNLKLRCMCSDDDDKADIEISDVEAMTEITGDMMFGAQHNQIMHCDRGHCCYFLRCCYCMENNLTHMDTVASNATANAHNQCQTKCVNHKLNSNSVRKKSHLSSNCTLSTKQNLVCKRCDEICKLINRKTSSLDKNEMGLCTLIDASGESECNCSSKCCDDNNGKSSSSAPKSIQTTCHCRWLCVQNCDSAITIENSNANNVNQGQTSTSGTSITDASAGSGGDNGSNATASQERPPQNSTTASCDIIDEENPMRCSRCARIVSPQDNRSANYKSTIENINELRQQHHHLYHQTGNLTLSSSPEIVATASVECKMVTTNPTSEPTEIETDIADDANSDNPNDASTANNTANKRNKPSDKLVLDLNDRSKYTKEVSV